MNDECGPENDAEHDPEPSVKATAAEADPFLEQLLGEQALISTSCRHEAGHVAVAWLISGVSSPPPIEHVSVGSVDVTRNERVVPGETKLVAEWFNQLSPIDRAAITMAGVFFERGKDQDVWDAKRWDSEAGEANGAEDFVQLSFLGRSAGIEDSTLKERGLDRLRSLEPLLSKLVTAISEELMETSRARGLDLERLLRPKLSSL